MAQEKKARRRELDSDAEAFAALEEARAMPPGPERTKAMKKAGNLRKQPTCSGSFLRSAAGPRKSS